ncbi:MAG: hypothetical protein ABSG01_16425 [Anaerolineales bacterium]
MELYILSNFVRTPTTRPPGGSLKNRDNALRGVVGVAEGVLTFQGGSMPQYRPSTTHVPPGCFAIVDVAAGCWTPIGVAPRMRPPRSARDRRVARKETNIPP